MDDPLRACLKTVRFHLVRNDHVNEPSGHRCTMALIEAIDRALSAAPSSETAAQASVPEGFVLVPIEPTRAMVDAGWNTGALFSDTRMIRDLTAAYRAMLAAAPRSTETGR